ncbi:MAG TPA: hypothetical protein VK210_05375 [Terriglobia bacterium]|nr:hypothetical protein [Terriglobia bacterium]
MKRIFAFSMGAALIVGMTLGALSLRAADRIRICHVEGHQSGRAHVIEISVSALAKHLVHGDSLKGAEGLDVGDDCVIPDTDDSTS